MPERDRFPTTRWTLVLATNARDESGRKALEWLCERYWQPLYEYASRRCGDREKARDLTQEFVVALLERKWLTRADPERGRFRTYLLTALQGFLSDQFDRARAFKRGGDRVMAALPEVAGEATPEILYERQWARTLLERVTGQMREEFARSGRAALFDHLKPFLTGEGDYAHAAAASSMNEGAVRVAVHRLRKQYKQRLIEEIAQTVASPAEIESEIRYLIGVLRQVSP